ncbi:STAS domain-containing protein [Streptomyces ficellus]|uniref:Anti-sigma factor antagonist n=1 Tax=Streptomyces ficellus TaxID=1977088 RepID=A0ABT7Z6Q8_9ACTN|nr:STAS domain-containing protein [Streptomyces ficellus]MDN3295190.1 STAS domain-containing protein [Streptomyces ficellus]
MTDALHLTLQHTDGPYAVATVTGDVDLHTAPTLRSGALDLIQQGHRHLILDMRGVQFCDSAGLSALIRIWHGAKDAGGSLALAAVSGRLMRMLNLTGMDSLLPVHPTADDALSGSRPTADA